MHPKSPMLLVFLAGLGCASQAGSSPPAATAARKADAVAVEAAPTPLEPAETLAQADSAYDSQLGALRGGQFDVDRQVAVLRQAVLLYTQFLERADGRPELLPAVRKSHERIADANATIDFLLASARSDGQPPPARSD